MKKIMIVALVSIVSTGLFAQEKTDTAMHKKMDHKMMGMKKDLNTCFMASNLINEKLKKQWDKIENKQELRKLIFTNIYDLIGVNNVLNNKLSMLISTLVIKSIDEWESSIMDLTMRASSSC